MAISKSENYELKLWAAADKMRNNMDPAEYKHVVLGLIFLKYISDRFEVKFKELVDEGEGFEEDRDEYTSENIFFVPEIARWSYLRSNAKSPNIGVFIDEGLQAIEAENKSLKGVLDKRYGRSELDKTRLGELIDLLSDVNTYLDPSESEQDLLGRIYEYFLGRFASSEGKGGGEFYTPTSVVKTLVEMIEPFNGRVYDPCCGSGGMFVQSEKFVLDHSGRVDDLSVYGQESNPTTWKLARMNLAIRGIGANLGKYNADTFLDDQHPLLLADYVLANPPFNISDWGIDKIKDDHRFKYGVPPSGNANYGWIQHILSHLKSDGVAGIVLANGSLSTSTKEEYAIRKNLLEDDQVDCIVAMPDKLFLTTGIPVCAWFFSKKKDNVKYRKRKGEVLFIDARKMGDMVNRRIRELSNDEISLIAKTYHEFRNIDGNYEDVLGFCKSVGIEEIKSNDYVLTPGRYVV